VFIMLFVVMFRVAYLRLLPEIPHEDAEGDHDEMARDEECEQDACHVHACHCDLAVALLFGEVSADAEQEHRGADRIDDGQQRDEGHADPGEKVEDFLHCEKP